MIGWDRGGFQRHNLTRISADRERGAMVMDVRTHQSRRVGMTRKVQRRGREEMHKESEKAAPGT
ncbi:MAG: hypothetical protein WCH05_10930 [Chlorobiaceae bacterium]